MKKILNISWCLLLVLGFASCDSDDDHLDTKSVGGYAYLSDRSISVFDTNADLTIDLFTAEGVTAESIEILQDGQVIGNGTVSGETASFNTSILGALEADSYPVAIRTTYSNGNTSLDYFSVSAGHAISLDGDNPVETNMDDLPQETIAYEVETFSATVDNVSLWLKKNEDGTYVEQTGVTLSTEGDAVVLEDTDYASLNLMEGDVLYYQFVAESGSLTDSAEGSIEIKAKSFDTSGSVTLSSDPMMDNLDLTTGEVTADGGEIAYLDPTGFQVVNGAAIEFVSVSDTYFDTLSEDVINAREAFMAGSTVTTATNVDQGDVFVYQATRDVEDEDGNVTTVTTYGIMEIDSVTTVTVDGESVTSIDISYGEGS